MDEGTSEVCFKNFAANRINERLKSACNFSLLDHTDHVMALSTSKFQPTDYNKIKNGDYEQVM